MTRRNLFGVEQWTNEIINELMSDLDTSRSIDDYQGYRRTERNGEVTEEVLVDGEWTPLAEAEAQESGSMFEVSENGNGYTMTFDVSQQLPLRDFNVSASLNNGVLEVSFSESDE